MVKPTNKANTSHKKKEPEKLSKLGEAVRDKTLPSFGKIVDMKAALK